MHSAYFATFARYNAWANRRLYAACEKLSTAEYLRGRPSAWGSIHGTLNHVLVSDRIWLARIEGRPVAGLRPDQILYADLIGLKIARIAEDDRLRNLVDGLVEAKLDDVLEYSDSEGRRRETPLRIVLGQLFNDHTHHRAQAHALLFQTAVAPPALGFDDFLRA